MRHLVPLLALIISLLVPAHTRAQELIISDPRFTDDQRDCIVMTLRLDEAQQDAFDDLAVVYAMEIQEIFTEVEQMGERFEEEGEEFTVKRGIELWEQISKRITDRQDRLFEDLALFLNESQAERIDRCRDRLRRMGITDGDITGALPGGFSMGMDPITLAIEMGLPDGLDEQSRQDFERAMESYDRTMKRNIDDVLEDVLDLVSKYDGFEENPMLALTELADEIDKVVESAKSMREGHKSMGHAIARSLPENLATRWNDQYKRAMFPVPYSKIDSEVLLDRLLEQPALTTDELDTVLEMTAELEKRTAAIRDEWCREIDDFLGDFKFNVLAMMTLNPDGIGTPFRERMEELNDQYLQRIPQRVQNPIVQDLMDAMFDTEEPEGSESSSGRVEVRIETAPE